MTDSFFARLVARTTFVGDCWVWTGATDPKGYGRISVGGRAGGMRLVHREAYLRLVGAIPDGLVLDHVKARGCTSSACWNPAHLEPVTNRENVVRGTPRNAKKDRCPAGHPYDAVYRNGPGKVARVCRRCRRDASARHAARV